MHNLYSSWIPPVWRLVIAQCTFWGKFVRPMGALYYRPLFVFFGLNPVPFTIVRTLVLLVNTVIFLRLALRITRSAWVAVLASFPVAYHANLGNLAYDGAFIYDVLCGAFYFSALLYYIRCRRANKSSPHRGLNGDLRFLARSPLTLAQTCCFLVLYVCALNSKEMAVSLPVILLAYELFYKGRDAQVGAALVALAITGIFVVGKTTGAGALTELAAYRPVFTWARFSESTTLFANTIFYTNSFTMGRVIAVWILLLYFGLRNWGLPKWDPRWLFLLVWVVVTPLPISFLPDRGGGTLYIVAAGWAMLLALVARAVAHRWARQPVAGLPPRGLMALSLAGCIAAYWHETARADHRVLHWYLTDGSDGEEAVRQLRSLRISPRGAARVTFLNDPFPKTYHTLFIAALVWEDPAVEINLQNVYQLPQAELQAADYVLDYVDGRIVVVKPKRPPEDPPGTYP
jgi:hypothetical protein